MRVAVRAACVIVLLAGCSDTVIEPAASMAKPEFLRAELVMPASVRLTWQAVTAGAPPITYGIYRDNARIGETTTTDFVDTSVASNVAHVWYVTARSASGDLSAPSDPVTIAIGDIESPRIIATTPSASATGSSRLPSPTVTFSEPMIPASINYGSMVVRLTGGGERVFGTVSYDAATRTADFWPLSILPAHTSITVTVTPDAKDVAGNGLAAPFSFSFTTGDSPSSASQLPPSAEPLLLSHRGGVGFLYDVFKANLDGTVKTNLTNHVAADIDASWSPDRRHIAFSSDRDGTYDVYVMREDGKGLHQLTFGDKDQTQPRWSSDARRIVFSSSKDGVPPLSNLSTPRDVWSMNADGTGATNLTRTPAIYENWPQWSPDGSKLTFTSTTVLFNADGVRSGTRTELMISNADANGAAPLLAPDTAYLPDVASWSPDGTRIAFSVLKWDTDPFSDTWLIYSIRPDGSDLAHVTTAGSRRHPAWSPDGRSVASSLSGFNEFWGRFNEIAVVRLDLATRVTTTVVSSRPGAEIMSPQAWRR